MKTRPGFHELTIEIQHNSAYCGGWSYKQTKQTKRIQPMGATLDIGRRIELIPMDPHFHDITIALYLQGREEGAAFLVHTYSQLSGAKERVSFVAEAMCRLGGMELTADGLVHFPCWSAHEAACRRVFIESCKLASSGKPETRPLSIVDKKSGLKINVFNCGEGAYQIGAEGDEGKKERRVSAIARALCKLGEMEKVDQAVDRVAFSCGHDHDETVGLLLVRAPNVRVALKEQELASSRGILSAPGKPD
jgi:hypothetical protein